ncbi:putative glycoside hydrolase [Paenibacillus albus]|uniref:GTP-binding protein n=1 Tax=Paenibacillus albus TaxID=2495582 RepID=A0A3Q8X9M2_9BACL|nr:putative glycoside hydrolase [Paenibacillus albus]AZN43513.1 GTP-binding protein [Paenibacillus albus]
MVDGVRTKAFAIMTALLVCTSCGSSAQLQEASLPPLKNQQKPSNFNVRVDAPHTYSAVIKSQQTQTQARTARVRKLSVPSDPVKGIYVSGWVAGSKKRLERLIQLVDHTDLNAMVIDVKNDYGQLTYKSSLPEVKAIGADRHAAIGDVNALLRKLKDKHIYVIGRIVTFKDPLYAKSYPSLALQKKSGGVWRDVQGKVWLDPFQQRARAYNAAIAKEAATIGFDEIQFDYVRFPDNGAKVDREVQYSSSRGGKSKSQVIAQFLQEATGSVHAAGARVSADVFGLVTSSANDMGIGQSWRSISKAVDVISPMTYPSHYSTGMYGVKQPDLSPYAIIRHAMMDAKHRNNLIKGSGSDQTPAIIRPWLQSFTAKWVHPHQQYGAEQVNKQIQAAKEQGVHEFLLWSSNCKYDYRS